ncbi:autotransporter outer membrane beta-barrel domain-containing protein [Desulfovibrio sp. Huiquan2017]|uniref:autotransporter family protein n=1 Tax=Desulfovibrio sp. Huiquan2017 TaxID=2816861 RepID=UPI001A9233B7|nr:autotransporter outer membrane beta-barrel domain-containing protein [Desulfovibrio sp. Huiquan2017]
MPPAKTKTPPLSEAARRVWALALFIVLFLSPPAIANAESYDFTDGNTWIIDGNGTITNTGTLKGTWTLSPTSYGGGNLYREGGIQANGAAEITNLGTIDLSGSIPSGSHILFAMRYEGTTDMVSMINRGSITGVTSGPLYLRGLYNQGDQNYTVNSGSITLLANDATYAVGIQVVDLSGERSTLINSGTVTCIAYSGYTEGINSYHNLDTYNSGRITSITYGGGFARGVLSSGSATYRNTIHNTGTIEAMTYGTGQAQGAYISRNATFHNASRLSAMAYGSGDALAAFMDSGASLYNTGIIKAAAQGGGTAYAVYAEGGDVHLQTGTRILGGQVYGTAGSPNLFLDGQGAVDFDVTGTWDTLSKTDSGTWTVSNPIAATIGTMNVTGGKLDLTGGITNPVTNINLSSGAILSLPTSSRLTATGTATLDGALRIDPSAANLGTTTTILSAGTLTTGAGYTATGVNPDFTVNVNTNPGAGTVTATTTFTPADDNAALGATATLASARAFADAAGTRGLTLLAEAGDNDDEILVAANGSMSGLLDSRTEDKPWSVYLQPVVTAISRDRDGRTAGYDAMLTGFEGGVDRIFGDALVLGAMAGFGTVDLSFTDNAYGTSDDENQYLYTLGVYGGYRMGDWKFTDTLTATYTDHDSRRAAGLNQTAEADYDSWLVSDRFLAVYDWRPVENWTFAPRAGLNLSWLYREEFEEDGAINAVAYDTLNEIITEVVLGVRATHDALDVHGVALTPYVGAGLVHTLTGADFTVRQRLASASADVTTETGENRLTAETGMTLTKGDMAFTLGYAGAYDEYVNNHSFTGTLRWVF